MIRLSLLLMVSLSPAGCISPFYTELVDNAPLIAPVSVTRVENGLLHLEDGRVLQFTPCDWIVDAEGALADAGSVIDLELDPGAGDRPVFHVFISRSAGGRCGMGDVGVITIPLIKVEHPRNYRVELGTATLKQQE